MKLSTYLRLVACLFMLVNASFSVNAQSLSGNILTDANGYYGGFESGDASIAAGRGYTDLSVGSAHGEYQIVSPLVQPWSDADGGGYLSVAPHSGNYMMLVHTDKSRLWYKQISVTSGQALNFCAWVASAKAKPANGFEVRLRVKYNNTTAVIATSVAQKGAWSQICGTFTVPAGVASVEFQLIDPFPDTHISNFLYLDDINLRTVLAVYPDINATYVNIPVKGSVATNDAVPTATGYGTPSPAGANPSGAAINLMNDGTYTFTANKIGVYVYHVPVCAPYQGNNCYSSALTITVLEKGANSNPPVANTDFAVTKYNTAATLKTLANDAAGYIGGTLDPASVTVATAPRNGTAVVNPLTGAIVYTPNAGFAGNDTLQYRVSDNTSPAPLVATALQIITVLPGANTNTTSAADDYTATTQNTPVSGNVSTNDTDPEGHAQSVTPQTTTVAGKGTLMLSANGAFTFVPVSNFAGPVSFVYTTCDNGTPQACANATLYILVQDGQSLSPLPVRLFSFAGKAQNETVLLNWETVSESNSSHFVVEYSTNGNTWQAIGKVAAAGNSDEKKVYSFTHANAAKGANYYRLQLVDKNGAANTSNVVAIRLSTGKTTLNSTYPNPFSNRLQLSLSSESAAIAAVQLFDVTGRLVQRTERTLVKGENLLVVDNLSTLNKGTYFVKITVGDVTLTEKIFK